MPPPHPLRRISSGSLSSLARSQDRAAHSPSGLDFLAPALTELADEAVTLAANTQRLNELHDALGTFNEAFAGWLYALKMNAFCVEWPEAPDLNSFSRMEKLQSLMDAQTAATAPPGASGHPFPTQTTPHEPNPADLTYATVSSVDDAPPPRSTGAKSQGAAVKKGVPPSAGAGAGAKKGPANAALRKKRELEIAGYIETLPLEYRGREPAMRLGMESVIGKLMDNPQGLAIGSITSPELPQTKANKHLIVLVAKKLVTKATVDKVSVYRWVGA